MLKLINMGNALLEKYLIKNYVYNKALSLKPGVKCNNIAVALKEQINW